MKKIDTRNELNTENRLRYFEMCFSNGLRSIRKNPVKAAVTILYWLSALVLLGKAMAPKGNLIDKLFQPVLCVSIPVIAVSLFVIVVTAFAIPPGASRIAHAFQRASITNAAGEPPLVTGRFEQNGKPVIEVFTQGVPVTQIQENLEVVESALGSRVTKIEQGKNNQHLLLHLAPGDAKLPDKIPLPDTLPDSPSVVLLGESLDGPVSVDFNRMPHTLVGGSTGSGKTQLIISIIAQLLRKKDARGQIAVDCFVFDFKAGSDFLVSWRKRDCSFSTDAESALIVLSQLVEELQDRKRKFATACDNTGERISSLDDFNRLYPDESLRRIVLIVDEIADLTDTTGMDKPEKERAAIIVKKLSAIARQGRAFGINLIISTQRPDVVAVPGVLKNNCDCRVAGKADNVLSQIILDNVSASDLIPKDSQGLFINQDGVVFRGYLFDGIQT